MKLFPIIITILILLTVTYAIFLARDSFTGPSINIERVNQVEETQLLEITGIVENYSYIDINDTQIYPEENGRFTYSLPLPEGYSIVKLYARNRNQKEHTKLIPINIRKHEKENNKENSN